MGFLFDALYPVNQAATSHDLDSVLSLATAAQGNQKAAITTTRLFLCAYWRMKQLFRASAALRLLRCMDTIDEEEEE